MGGTAGIDTAGGRFDGVDAPTRAEIFDVLSNGRRRRVIEHLQRRDGAATLSELVDHVAAGENEHSIAELTPEERKRVYTALRQAHLPKMDELGVVEYDHEAGRVNLTPGTEQAYLHLEYVPEHDISWSALYLGLSAFGAVLGLLVHFEILLFGNVPSIALTAILLASFAVAASAHTVWSRRRRIGIDDLVLDSGEIR